MDIEDLKKRIFIDLTKVKNLADLEQFRIKYLGRKGAITSVLKSLKDLSMMERKKLGIETNRLKKETELKMGDLRGRFIKKEVEIKGKERRIDITAPGIKIVHGHLHPLTHIMRKVEDIFQSMGFRIVEGPDIETEYYNFDALNIPQDHPARDAWNTFWLKTKPQRLLLRTHTSPMQVRFMEKNNPPFRIIVPGRVFRYEATDASHFYNFYQLEGLMVDTHISIANFKAVVEEFLKKLFGEEIETRMRPSYYPFVEPGFDIEMKYPFGGWMEIMGAGMVHPNVFKSVGYVPGNWQGFAFGIGIDRIAMLKYKINDIRLLYSSDLHFLNQF
jgi:phenylalanyl-tRNA synthetase alpha chain